LAGGNYTIQKFYIEKTEGNTIYQMTLNGPFPITIEDGVVNNMGTIQIDIGNEGYSLRVVDYDTVKYDFQNDFPDAEWNSYEWKNSSVNSGGGPSVNSGGGQGSRGTSSQDNGSRVKTSRPASERNEPAKTDAELVAEAIQWGDCPFLYDYTQKEDADKQLVSQANNALKRYTGLDSGTGKYRTNKMEAAVRLVPKESMEQVFVDPETALSGVVSSLTKGVSDQFLKAKILHDWICDNIAYDAEMYLRGRITAQDYVSVLKKKKAVCSGYTNVMNQMCELAGIESIGINGYSKGFGYTGKIGKDTDHAWNAVHIGNK
jgi:transglutaminase/protease-like cytokinesis protein 3